MNGGMDDLEKFFELSPLFGELAKKAYLKDWGGFQRDCLTHMQRESKVSTQRVFKFVHSLAPLQEVMALGWYLKTPKDFYEYLCVSLGLTPSFETDADGEPDFIAYFNTCYPCTRRVMDAVAELSIVSQLQRENERLRKELTAQTRKKPRSVSERFHNGIVQYLTGHPADGLLSVGPTTVKAKFDYHFSGYVLAECVGEFARGDKAVIHISFEREGQEFSYELREVCVAGNRIEQLIWVEEHISGVTLEFSSPRNTLKEVSLRPLKKLEAHSRRLLNSLPKLMRQAGGVFRFAQISFVRFRRGGLSAVKALWRAWGLESCYRDGLYLTWIKQYESLSPEDRTAIATQTGQFSYQPKISILLPTYNISEALLRKAIESVEKQLYPNWELCIADDASTAAHIPRVLEEYTKTDPRIKAMRRPQNGHIANASNSALELATGEFTALLDHDDEIAPTALYRVVEALNRNPSLDLLYSDEDKIDAEGNRSNPHFKSDWNPELFACYNMITHLAVMRTQLMRKVGGFTVGTEGSQDYDLFLKVIEATSSEKIHHIPHVLYHWRMIPGSTAIEPTGKMYAHEAARDALRRHFERTGVRVKVTEGKDHFTHRIRYDLPEKLPLVSAIICTKDRKDMLETVVNGLLKQTKYREIEILIVDNKSVYPETLEYLLQLETSGKARVLKYPAPFNYSHMNNIAAKEARGELLLFLNNDLEVISPEWLTEMVRVAMRPSVGVVGARLLYPDNKIQHAGVVLGIGGVAGHIFHMLKREEFGYYCRLQTPQVLSAVTGACLAVKKDLFDRVCGFDHFSLPIAFSDIDLCLRVGKQGLDVIWTPHAELYHLESVSRGSDDTNEHWPRFRTECQVMRQRWGELLQNDPYYNPNLSLTGHLFHYAFPPRVSKPWLMVPKPAGSTGLSEENRHTAEHSPTHRSTPTPEPYRPNPN